MAGDWIKMRLDLQTHPKVVRILSATKSDKFRVIGGLHAVWSVFDTHSADGRLDGYTPDTLDHIIGWPGFSDAMISVGWLGHDEAEALILPEFDEHNGKSGKRRADDQKRKREDRKSPQVVRKTSEDNADEKLTREEKRREDNKVEQEQGAQGAPVGDAAHVGVKAESKFDPKAALADGGVEKQQAADFLQLRKTKKAPLTLTALEGIQREAAKAGINLAAAVAICCENGWAGFKADWHRGAGQKGAARGPGTDKRFFFDGAAAASSTEPKPANFDPAFKPAEELNF